MPTRKTPEEVTEAKRRAGQASRSQTAAAKAREAKRHAAAAERADVLRDLRSDSEITWVPVTQCFRDMTYQRPTNEARVRKMRDEFDPDLLGVVTLSDRGEKSIPRYAILDGGHRVDLYVLMDWNDQQILSQVYKDLTLQQEAHIYAIMNSERVRPTTLNLFLARVAANEPAAVLLKEAVEAGGAMLSTDYRPGARYFRAIAEAERVFRVAGPEVVRQAVWCMTEAWSSRQEQDTYPGSVFSGIAYILHHFKGRVDVLTLGEKLKDVTPHLIMNQSKAMKDVTRHQMVVCTASVIAQVYNKFLRSRRLPDVPTTGWGKTTHQILFELQQAVNVPYIMVEGKILTPGEVEKGV